MDPWDVPEPKTLKSLPKLAERSLKPDVSGFSRQVPAAPDQSISDAPAIHSNPTEEINTVRTQGFEVIRTPPPARERVQVGLPSEVTEEAPRFQSDAEGVTEEIAKTDAVKRSPQPAGSSEPIQPGLDDDDYENAKKGLPLLWVGAGAGVLFAAAIAGLLFFSNGSTVESSTVADPTPQVEAKSDAPEPTAPDPVVPESAGTLTDPSEGSELGAGEKPKQDVTIDETETLGSALSSGQENGTQFNPSARKADNKQVDVVPSVRSGAGATPQVMGSKTKRKPRTSKPRIRASTKVKPVIPKPKKEVPPVEKTPPPPAPEEPEEETPWGSLDD